MCHSDQTCWYKHSRDLGDRAHIETHLNDVEDHLGGGGGNGRGGSGNQHRSHLIVRRVRKRDGGRYRCSSDLTEEAYVDVKVVKTRYDH